MRPLTVQSPWSLTSIFPVEPIVECSRQSPQLPIVTYQKVNLGFMVSCGVAAVLPKGWTYQLRVWNVSKIILGAFPSPAGAFPQAVFCCPGAVLCCVEAICWCIGSIFCFLGGIFWFAGIALCCFGGLYRSMAHGDSILLSAGRILLHGVILCCTWSLEEVPNFRKLVPSTWYLVPSAWYLLPGTWYLIQITVILSAGYLVLSAWCLAASTWYLVPPTSYLVHQERRPSGRILGTM